MYFIYFFRNNLCLRAANLFPPVLQSHQQAFELRCSDSSPTQGLVRCEALFFFADQLWKHQSYYLQCFSH